MCRKNVVLKDFSIHLLKMVCASVLIVCPCLNNSFTQRVGNDLMKTECECHSIECLFDGA